LLLPDVVGYQVGKVLNASGIPFVFMTGVFKGARLAREGTEREGARAYFEEPFEAGTLVGFLGGVVAPDVQGEEEEAAGCDTEIDRPEAGGEPIQDLEMTGRSQVEAGAVQAILQGKDFHLPPATPSQVLVRPQHEAPAPEITDPRIRAGKLRDNLPHLMGAFW